MVTGTILRAPSLNAAVERLADPSFDPRTMVVLPGERPPAQPGGDGPPSPGPPGAARVLEDGPERLAVEIEATAPGVLVVQRAWQPIYRASVDGTPVPVRIANLHRIGIDSPAGRHRVDLWVDRTVLHASFLLSVLGLFGLAALARRPRGTVPEPVTLEA